MVNIPLQLVLPVVLYGCETWSFTLREEHRLRMSENRLLRRIFRPERDEVAAGWRRLHNEELQNLYASPNRYGDQIMRHRIDEACSTHR
jgi:hypothetical protein